ncbi:MAG: putative aminohydrolase SsnA [Thermoanaerobaculaceae bacterium]|nr:putative aminohydrolase SsnA [Thermoanaerobaculaceae bacterium]MDI9620415.1 putative aminohydrolase SsnA [Acidobacteriota bacterium]NLH12360.1 putative aminohydrolase SsnA [Holophagae bacterium]HPW55097.1 putative aminohydrolase SsnA [Thermoanaerobaculaceae bacterium]
MSAVSRRLIVDGGVIATLGEPGRVLEGHALVIEGERITAIARHGEVDRTDARVVDAAGKLVLPGFINAHMHFYSTLVRGLGKAEPAASFQEVLEHLWWRLDRQLTLEDCYVSALIALLQAIRHGTTTLVDHHASPHAVRGSLPAIARAVRDSGLRASLCYELSDRDGETVAREGIEENIAWIGECATSGGEQLKALFGLHASFTIGDRTLAAAAQAGHDLGVGFHVHTAEAASDQEACQRDHGCRVVERFARAGILGEKTICAHGVHLSERELELLAEWRAAVVHNPQSNMNNAVGVADVPAMSRAGVLVGLGTDAMTTNMLEELRAALWVRHLAARNPSVGFAETVGLLLSGNARIASRYWQVPLGVLAPGAAADVVLVDYQPPTPLDEGTLLGHLVFGVSQSQVDTTICRGRVLMHGKRLCLDIDEAAVAARARELAAALWRRF